MPLTLTMRDNLGFILLYLLLMVVACILALVVGYGIDLLW